MTRLRNAETNARLIPAAYRVQNLFRYECRLDERTGDFFTFPVPNITAFYNTENCVQVIDVWRRQSDAITKAEPSLTKVSDLSALLKCKERNGAEYLLQKGGKAQCRTKSNYFTG